MPPPPHQPSKDQIQTPPPPQGMCHPPLKCYPQGCANPHWRATPTDVPPHWSATPPPFEVPPPCIFGAKNLVSHFAQENGLVLETLPWVGVSASRSLHPPFYFIVKELPLLKMSHTTEEKAHLFFLHKSQGQLYCILFLFDLWWNLPCFLVMTSQGERNFFFFSSDSNKSTQITPPPRKK